VTSPNIIVRELAASTPTVEIATLRGKLYHCPLCSEQSKGSVTKLHHKPTCAWIQALNYVRETDND
jgi:hypothetical protein